MTLDLILERAVRLVKNEAEAEEMASAEYVKGISFELYDPEKRIRFANAFRKGTLQLKRQLQAGDRVHPYYGPGNIPKLDEIVALLDRFTPASL